MYFSTQLYFPQTFTKLIIRTFLGDPIVSKEQTAINAIVNNFNLMSISSECLIDVKSEKKATNAKNKFVKDVCKYALYAKGVFCWVLEYGIWNFCTLYSCV